VLDIYRALAQLALDEFSDIVAETTFLCASIWQNQKLLEATSCSKKSGGVKMQPATISGYETILGAIRRWPPERRFALVQDVLDTLAAEVVSSRLRRKTLAKALGLLATDRPAPSDTEVRQWLDERRMEKYG